MNGKTKTVLGFIPIALVIGLVFRFGGTENQVKENVKDIVEVKKETKKIPKIEANQIFMMAEQQIIKKDIKEILRVVK